MPHGPYALLSQAFDASPNLNPAERAVLWRMTRYRANRAFQDNFCKQHRRTAPARAANNG